MNIRKLALCAVLLLPLPGQAAEPGAAAEWPLTIEGARVPIVLYQPQPESIEGDSFTARAAVMVHPTGKDPVFGAVWMEAHISTDRDARLVTVEEVKISRTRLTGATPEQEKTLSQILAYELTRRHFVISLDRFLVSLESVKKQTNSTDGLKMDPPRIYVEKETAVLVLVDGEPQLRPIKGSADQRVVNTPFELIFTPAKQWRLKGGDRWLTAPDLNGPWRDEAAPSNAIPKIIVSQEPAELIVSEGEPEYVELPGNRLRYMKNTSNDVFVETATSRVFVLLSGRWYTAADLQGPWTPVRPDQLPAAFAKIPLDSPKASVLASVAGTEQAQEAVLDAMIPQTAAISRKEHDNKLQITWDGDPKFQEIQGLSVSYSLNASAPVFRVGEKGYWACSEGIWYEAKNPKGPWAVATSVPKEIEAIPPSCPYYYCRYVQVYQTNGDIVYVGYEPGYVGSYPYYGTVVYGTGYYYHGWYGLYYYYPPPMVTWGYCFRYNPYTGWGAGVAWGPGGAGWIVAGGGGAAGGWWGPGGAHVTPYQGNREQAKQNVYDRAASRSNDRQTASQTPAKDRESRAKDRGEGDVFTDRDGNVTRRTDDGKWQTRDGDKWKDTATPSQDVVRDSAARDRGAQRASQYQAAPRTPAPSRPTGGYSGRGGGGMRGGGGRR